jgi:Zn-dependent protease
MGLDFEQLKQVPLWVIALLISGSFHEFSHAMVAWKLGDPTAERVGRLTLNPLVHIDPTGLIMIIISSMVGFGFGWMKPVPVDPRYFRNPRVGMMLVSFSGPLSNMILAALFILLFRLLGIQPNQVYSNPLGLLLFIFLELNVILAVFNLLPIPPLDGSHILEGILPEDAARTYEKIYPYGFVILLFLMFTHILGAIFNPVMDFVLNITFGPL